MRDIPIKERKIDSQWLKIGVQGDSGVERYRFVIERYTGNGTDLSEGMGTVVFRLPDGSEGVSKLEMEPVDEIHIGLVWEIGQEATQQPGTLEAALRISGLENRLWHSETGRFTVGKTIPVPSGQFTEIIPRKASRREFVDEAAEAVGMGRIADPSKETPITIMERAVMVPAELQNIAVQNDKNSEEVSIVFPRYFDGFDLSRHEIYLRTLNSDGGRDDILFTSANKEIVSNEIHLRWMLKPPQTSYSGKLTIQLMIKGQDFQWSSNSAVLNIIRLLDGEPVIPENPSAYETWLNEMLGIKQETIAESKKWLEQSKDYAQNSQNYANQSKGHADNAAEKAAEAEQSVAEITDKLEAAEDVTQALENTTNTANNSNTTLQTAINQAKAALKNLQDAIAGAELDQYLKKTETAASANKLETARRIALTGAVTGSGEFDGSGDINITATNKSCVVGGTSGRWFKFADTTISKQYIDRTIVFAVQELFGEGAVSQFGILRVHLRSESTVNIAPYATLFSWDYVGTKLYPENFVLIHKTDNTITNIELWAKCTQINLCYCFTVLQEADGWHGNIRTNVWNLYSNTGTNTGEESLPSDYTQVPSTYSGLKMGSVSTAGHLSVSKGVNVVTKGLDISSTFYIAFRVTVNKVWLNHPIIVVFTRNKSFMPTTIMIQFRGENNMDPGIEGIGKFGPVTSYYNKVSAGIYDFYVEKGENKDTINIINIIDVNNVLTFPFTSAALPSTAVKITSSMPTTLGLAYSGSGNGSHPMVFHGIGNAMFRISGTTRTRNDVRKAIGYMEVSNDNGATWSPIGRMAPVDYIDQPQDIITLEYANSHYHPYNVAVAAGFPYPEAIFKRNLADNPFIVRQIFSEFQTSGYKKIATSSLAIGSSSGNAALVIEGCLRAWESTNSFKIVINNRTTKSPVTFEGIGNMGMNNSKLNLVVVKSTDNKYEVYFESTATSNIWSIIYLRIYELGSREWTINMTSSILTPLTSGTIPGTKVWDLITEWGGTARTQITKEEVNTQDFKTSGGTVDRLIKNTLGNIIAHFTMDGTNYCHIASITFNRNYNDEPFNFYFMQRNVVGLNAVIIKTSHSSTTQSTLSKIYRTGNAVTYYKVILDETKGSCTVDIFCRSAVTNNEFAILRIDRDYFSTSGMWFSWPGTASGASADSTWTEIPYYDPPEIKSQYHKKNENIVMPPTGEGATNSRLLQLKVGSNISELVTTIMTHERNGKPTIIVGNGAVTTATGKIAERIEIQGANTPTAASGVVPLDYLNQRLTALEAKLTGKTIAEVMAANEIPADAPTLEINDEEEITV